VSSNCRHFVASLGRCFLTAPKRLCAVHCRIMAVIRATYLTDEGFTPDNAKRASPAAEGLCKWVHAMSKYDKVRPAANST